MLLNFLFLSLFNSFSAPKSSSNDNQFTIINCIDIIGNKKTKGSIIFRELDIVVGDTIRNENLEEKLTINKNKLINLALFLNVELIVENNNNQTVDLHIKVLEPFYILPYPVFRLADRSFNEWWYNRNHDFKRTIYGINFWHYNVGGRAEDLIINLENGFSKQIAIIYKKPYLNKAMKNGIEVNMIYNTNRQIPFKTFNDKLVFKNIEDNSVLKKFSTKLVLKRRNNFYERQRLELSFHKESISDSMHIFNPNYYLNGASRAKYFKATYIFEGDHRDNQIYALNGHYFVARLTRFGIFKSDNINQTELYLSYVYYMKLGKKWFGDFNFRTEITAPKLQAFATSTAFGYRNDNIRGYDLYVIDGQKFGLFKSNLRKQFLETSIKVPDLGFITKAQNLPISMYGRVFYDAGYVWNSNFQFNSSKLANNLISGFGVGLDIVSIYLGALRTSYSINNKGEKGLFFAYGKDF
jgi:hypothetical protein